MEARIEKNAEADFIPKDDTKSSAEGRIQRIDPSPAKVLQDEMLTSVHGGDIPARVSGRQVVPDGAYTRIAIHLDAPPPDAETLGVVAIDAKRASLAGRLARSILIVLIREWGA